jgi:hypothetical protein
LRESLINVDRCVVQVVSKTAISVANSRYRYWHELGFNVDCPIHFSQDELREHADDGDGWNEVQDFWRAVEGIVARDGWSSHSMHSEAMALFSELREIGLKNMIGKERRDFEAQTQWADGFSCQSQNDGKE